MHASRDMIALDHPLEFPEDPLTENAQAPSPGLAAIVPELAEGLLEQMDGVEPLVGGEQQGEQAPAVEAEVQL